MYTSEAPTFCEAYRFVPDWSGIWDWSMDDSCEYLSKEEQFEGID